jgi:ribosomal-protein-alanine N-acetyltransferase
MATVRRGTEGDLPAIRRIQTAALAEPWPAVLDLAAGDGGPRLRVVEAGTKTSPAHQPVGYVVTVTAGHPEAYVPELAILPDRQGEGLGSTLLSSLLAELADDGFQRVRLTARAEDERARSFYEDHGFEPVDRVADHFEDGDGVVLEHRF